MKVEHVIKLEIEDTKPFRELVSQAINAELLQSSISADAVFGNFMVEADNIAKRLAEKAFNEGKKAQL